MMWRFLSNFFFMLGLILLAVAAAGYFLYADAPGACVDEPEREFPNLAVGVNEVRFRLHNPTRHAVRVVGCQFC